ncbi:unnamed protein product [Durusdinium trenchii]|uniref:Tryptophan synthase beta chain-like PALP domain-containing protein n=1 Tax=Durusdinium trenchii TaxID=1381693 RepID=A0ABP0PA44_9DINO
MARARLSASLLQQVPYQAPTWASSLDAPRHRVVLGHWPTPLMPWANPALKELNVRWSLKRDDVCGVELSGNKTRKLEFLLSEALANGHDSVVTVGGLQSNHCRATAVCAKLLGLEPHVVLLVKDQMLQEDPGLSGNLLPMRLSGATLHLCPASAYRAAGGDLAAADHLNEEVAEQLRRRGRDPYVIPVGGTTPLGTWGYLNAVEEFQQQLTELEDPIDHILVPCGSGGTFAGLAVGFHLAQLDGDARRCRLHGVNIQHHPAAYHELIRREAAGLGCSSWAPVTLVDGSGAGYAVAGEAELRFLMDVAGAGVILDHTYAGKALYHFCDYAKVHPERFRDSHILFWHTGGLFGLYTQAERLQKMLPAEQLQVYNS